jgi:cardiolipin synthase
LSLRFLPNALTLLRILLVGPLAWALLRQEFALALLVFVVAAATDAADGLLAKWFGWTSELGKVLDPIADKLLFLVVFVVLAFLGLVPVWLAVLVIGRDVVIGTGALVFTFCFGPLAGRPTRVSKLNTLCLIFYVLSVIGGAAFAAVPDAVVIALGALVMVTTVVSGLNYVLLYARKAAEVHRQRAPR